MKFRYPQILMIVLCVSLGLTVILPAFASAGTFETRVSLLSDDAEENTAGTVGIN